MEKGKIGSGKSIQVRLNLHYQSTLVGGTIISSRSELPETEKSPLTPPVSLGTSKPSEDEVGWTRSVGRNYKPTESNDYK